MEEAGLWQWIKDRAKEPSTWQGVTAILGMIGIAVNPNALYEIAGGVISIIGGIHIIKKEPKK